MPCQCNLSQPWPRNGVHQLDIKPCNNKCVMKCGWCDYGIKSIISPSNLRKHARIHIKHDEGLGSITILQGQVGRRNLVSDELDEVVQARTTPEDALSSAPEVLAMLSKQTETFEELERVTKEIIMMQKFRIALLEDALQKNGIESPRGKDVKLPFRSSGAVALGSAGRAPLESEAAKSLYKLATGEQGAAHLQPSLILPQSENDSNRGNGTTAKLLGIVARPEDCPSYPELLLTLLDGGVTLDSKGLKKRKENPSSWGTATSQMKMKNRVQCAFDGLRRSWKDDLMLDTDYEVRTKLGDTQAYAADLDVQGMRHTDAFYNLTEEEKNLWAVNGMDPEKFMESVAAFPPFPPFTPERISQSAPKRNCKFQFIAFHPGDYYV